MGRKTKSLGGGTPDRKLLSREGSSEVIVQVLFPVLEPRGVTQDDCHSLFYPGGEIIKGKFVF